MRTEIQSLGKEVFDETELNEVDSIIRLFLGSRRQRESAVLRLRMLVPQRPKRPMYYVNYEMKYLQRRSRWVVEQMGSYLDLLVKEYRFEVKGKYSRGLLGSTCPH